MQKDKNSENKPDEPMSTTSKKQCTILQYVKGQDLVKMISKLAVVNGLSIITISKSEFIKARFSSKRLQLPRSPSSGMALILWHVDQLLGNDCGISKYKTAVA
jgi:hypothetical protein